MTSFTDSLIAWVAQYPNAIAYAVFLAAFAESLAVAGIVIPGVVILFGLAALAGGGAISLELTLMAAFGGAVAGDIVSFYLGRYFSDGLKNLWPLSKFPELIQRSEDFFNRHGGKSVFIGRFVGPVRPVLPAMAGAFGMSARRFISFNIGSALIWAPWYIIPGYLFGAAIRIDESLPPHFYPTLLVLILSILGITALFVQIHWHFRPQGRIYLWLYSTVRNSFLASFWQNSFSQRGKNREFPLNSALLFSFSVTGILTGTLLVVYLPQIKSFDLWILTNVETFRTEIANTLFISLTLSGDTLYLYLVFGWLILLMLLRKRMSIAATYLVAGFATHGITVWMKNTFEIIRPDSPFIPASFSFPSGHTSGATLVFGLLVATIAREFAPKQRWPLYAVTSILVLLIAFSRLYLGVHWLSDIMAGLLVGTALCGLTRLIQSRYDRQLIWSANWLAVLITGFAIITVSYQFVYLRVALELYTVNLI